MDQRRRGVLYEDRFFKKKKPGEKRSLVRREREKKGKRPTNQEIGELW